MRTAKPPPVLRGARRSIILFINLQLINDSEEFGVALAIKAALMPLAQSLFFTADGFNRSVRPTVDALQ
jgi:hypothetical protein